MVRASLADLGGFLTLAAEVEEWFGPMVTDAGFRATLRKNIDRGSAFAVRTPSHDLLGGVLIGGNAPTFRINWLVVAGAVRGRGIGYQLVNHTIDRFPRPCRVDVITFGRDHPGAVKAGARGFYERLGFIPGDEAPRGPEGGSRQWYHLELQA